MLCRATYYVWHPLGFDEYLVRSEGIVQFDANAFLL